MNLFKSAENLSKSQTPESPDFDKEFINGFITKYFSDQSGEARELLKKSEEEYLAAITSEDLDKLTELSKLINSYYGYNLEKSHDPGDEDKLAYLKRLEAENNKILALINHKKSAAKLKEMESDPDYYQDLSSAELKELKEYLLSLADKTYVGTSRLVVAFKDKAVAAITAGETDKLFRLADKIDSEKMRRLFNRWSRPSAET